MRWLEITVITPTETAEAVGSLFFDAGSGINLDDSAAAATGRVTIKGYLPDEPAIQPRLAMLQEHMTRLLGAAAFKVGFLQDEEWATAWQAGYKPLRVGERLVVKPTWTTYAACPGDLVIEMDPGLAFGCGTHPTTGGCMRMLEKYVRPRSRVYDVGTGSGILAIAAALLGAGAVHAVDDDPIAVRVARENIDLNRVNDRVTVVQGDLLRGLPGPVDLVVANIVAEVVGPIALDVAARLVPGGCFIAGGISRGKAPAVRDAFTTAGLTVVEEQTSGEWVVLVGARKG